MENKVEPILKLKPRFNPISIFSNKHIGTLAVLLFIGIPIIQNGGWMYYIPLLLVYLIYILVKLLITKYQYKNTRYLFFENKVIIVKKYGKKEDLRIPYKDIDDILLFQSYSQKFFGMGDLVIKLKNKNIFTNQVTLFSIDNIGKAVGELKGIMYG